MSKGMALSCKETFSLLYYEFDSAHKEPPPWEPESYKLIDRIAADEGRFTSNSEVIINTEVRSIPVTKKGVYFAFRDQGACLSLIAIKIYYVVCPKVTKSFGVFPETPTGKELTAIVSAEGQCVANAVEIEKPRLLCKGDGNWTLPSGGCKCMAGYEPVGQACRGELRDASARCSCLREHKGTLISAQMIAIPRLRRTALPALLTFTFASRRHNRERRRLKHQAH